MSNPENVCPTVQQRLAVVRAVEEVPQSSWLDVPAYNAQAKTVERYFKTPICDHNFRSSVEDMQAGKC